ncbi:microtubule-associated protein 4 isoform X3 [Paralichthys olivaceus]|uniref:microtubule-associated protein 4 isoform X3 n=1 Tax=Paralichthys olivaceus TaxID=8255 RepID=UPI0037532751
MAELDLSLSDALADAPQTGQVENLVERDFVAQLEAENYDDQVGETVGKTDYIPLLDNDDTRAGCKLTSGGQISASRPEPQGEVRPLSLDQKQASATDFLSASMAGYLDPLDSQSSPAQMMDTGLMGAFSGFTQPGGMGVNVEVGAATLQADRPPSIAEPQHATPPAGLEAPKEHGPMLPEPQVPRSPADLSAGALGDSWVDQAGCLSSDLPFSPSVNTMISRHASHLAASPDDPPDSWPSRESTAYAGGDERDGEGSDRKQKKKKKRRQKDEGSYENLESRGHPEMQALGENTPPTEEFFQRIGPRRERGEGGWEEQIGKSGGRGKKGKSRKKLPEEWGVAAEPFVPLSAATSQVTEEVMMDLGSVAPANLEASFTEVDTSHSPWKKEVYPDEGLVPAPLSEDLFSLTGAPVGPLVLNSELKATAAPFTMPSTANNATLGSSPMSPHFGDEVDLLMETENASLGNDSQAFSPSYSPDLEVSDMVDSGMFGNTSSLQESCMQVMPEGDTSAFSPASESSPGVFPKGEVLASAPPLSPSDASWVLNDSQISSNSEIFDFSDMSTSGPPLRLGLSFNTLSPAPLRSPKTTAQEFQQKEPKDETSSQKQSKKSRSSSSSSSVKSPTSPGAKKLPLQASPVGSPSSPPPVNPLGVPGSGLNPAAKPFFPSFADPMEEPAVVPPPAPTIEVKSDKMSEKKEEILEDSVKKTGHFEPLNKADQRGVKVEYASTETPAKVEKETEKEKQTEKEKEVKIEDDKKVKPKEAEEVKETDKQAEKVEEMKKETEKGKEKETEKVESMQQKEDEMTKAEESVEISVKTEKVEKVEMEEKVESKPEKTENIDKMDKSEKVKVEEKPENKNIEKLEKTAIKDDKEHIDKVEKTPEPQPTPVKIDTGSDKVEKEADRETKEADRETKEADKETKEADRETKEADRETKATAEVQENKKEKADADKAQKMEKEGEVEKPSEKPAEKPEQKSEKQEKQDQIQDEKKSVEKKDDKKDKAAKADVGEKVKKSKPLANGSSVAPNKDVAGADKKTKSGTGLTKPSAAAKMRPSSAAASSGSLAAPSKRPTPSSTTFTSDRKATTARAPSTATAGPKRPSTTPSSRLSLSATTSTTRDVKPKTTTEKRPLVPKASTATSNLTGPTAATKNGTATTAASKTTTSVRTSLTTRTSTTAAKKPLAPKTNSKPGDEKKPSTLKTTAADSTKPKTTTTTRSAGATTTTTTASRARTTAAKPATPSSSTVPEKKPLVPRAPRASFSSTTTATSKTATRPSTAPAPDIRNARSKIGSTDNMKHQPGGGKVSSASQSRAVASKDTSQGKVQIVSKKLDFSHVTSRLGSKDNMKHVPGGGNVQILNKKVDLSKVTSKCGSKDNIKHKPGGGDVKIGSHKVNFREKAQSKVGSTDNLSHSPGGGNIKAEGGQETTEGNGTPLSGTQAPAPGFEPGQAGDLAAHENGLKDGAPCDSESLREPQALDSSIPETSI